MTTGELKAGGYGPTPRQGLPGWVWGVGACACLPIAGVIALGLLLAPWLKGLRAASREWPNENLPV